VPNLTPEFRERMEDVLDQYEKPYNPAEPVVCMDEQPCPSGGRVKSLRGGPWFLGLRGEVATPRGVAVLLITTTTPRIGAAAREVPDRKCSPRGRF
jgi:hypothetical protein